MPGRAFGEVLEDLRRGHEELFLFMIIARFLGGAILEQNLARMRRASHNAAPVFFPTDSHRKNRSLSRAGVRIAILLFVSGGAILEQRESQGLTRKLWATVADLGKTSEFFGRPSRGLDNALENVGEKLMEIFKLFRNVRS